MKEDTKGFRRGRVCRPFLAGIAFLALASVAAAAQSVAFQLDAQHTAIGFTLGDVLHTVHGTFRLKRGALRLDPASKKLTGEIVVDAKSGESGRGCATGKCIARYWRATAIRKLRSVPIALTEPWLCRESPQCGSTEFSTSTESDHELTVPAEVEMFPDHWTATLHFAVPYVSWGMKNPSTLFLRVNESVDIDLTTGGTVSRP